MNLKDAAEDLKFDTGDNLTKEMYNYFIDRTTMHIRLVQKYSEKIAQANPTLIEVSIFSKYHDLSKFRSPEVIPYVFLSWKKKNPTFKMSNRMQERIHKATLHHVINNTHHPEFYANIKDVEINRKNRDEPPDHTIDCCEMSAIGIAEMVADWLAMSEELGTSTKDWANKNIGVRWGFSDRQVELIYDLIKPFS